MADIKSEGRKKAGLRLDDLPGPCPKKFNSENHNARNRSDRRQEVVSVEAAKG